MSDEHPQQPEQPSQDQGIGLIRRLLVSLGSGLSAAGGDSTLGPNLLKIIQAQRTEGSKLGGREKLNIQQQNAINLKLFWLLFVIRFIRDIIVNGNDLNLAAMIQIKLIGPTKVL